MVSLKSFPKIDAHFHSTSYNPVYEKIAKEYNVRYVNINTDTKIFPSLKKQEAVALTYIKKQKECFAYIASFEMDNWESDNWYQKTFTHIKKSVEKGAVGIKIWKNIGMEIVKSSDHTYLMIDDLFFDPLFKFLSENKIPLLAHLGEPKNCWLPLEEMTSDRNRLYYTNHPEFHAYLHPEIPNYDLQIQARDSLLAKFPDLVFVGAHLGSLEWSYEELSKRFDKYPDFKVDLSSRLGHLQMQSAKKYDGVRDFFMKYADRIIYGTDAYNDPEKLTSSLINDWKFLSTDEDCESTEVSKTFKGIQLPEEYLYKIYYENAIKTYNGLAFEQ
ncbi:MAG TPA: amidohydrolase family protein [Dysgonamonadaceae bacterium]|nr:amidohydrolase family protein [Dysgonamonadaceae bacterium]